MRLDRRVNIEFRRIGPSDVPNLVRWTRDEEVARWYWDVVDLTDSELVQKWTERATQTDGRTDRYIVEVDGQDIGEIQVGEMGSYPELAAEVGIPDSASVDIFIGEPEWRNRGIGTTVIRSFINQSVFSRPHIKTCVIDPEPGNLRAIRCYAKVGFRHVRTYHSDADDVDVYLMRLDRPHLSRPT